MNTKLIISLLFLTQLCTAQIDFKQISWDEATSLAAKEGKPIFVDVYTKWCGPCKILDQTIFQDKKVSKRMNADYINMKWDAEEGEFVELSKKYGINAYPTLLLFDSEGRLQKKVIGTYDRSTLMKHLNAFESFCKKPKLRNKLENYEQLSPKELSRVLRKASEVNSLQKEKAFDHLLESVMEDESWWKKYADVAWENVAVRHDAKVFERIIQFNKWKKGKIKSAYHKTRRMQRVLIKKMRKASRANDLETFTQFAKLNQNLKEKTSFKAKKEKLNESYKMDFLYFHLENKNKEEYAAVAESYVERNILNLDRELLRKKDNRDAKRMLSSDKNSPSNLPGYIIDYSYSYSYARTLDKLVQDYLVLFDDEEHLSTAKEWASLSVDFIPAPRFYLTLAKVQSQLGQKKEARKTIEQARNSKYYNEKVEEELQAFLNALD